MKQTIEYSPFRVWREKVWGDYNSYRAETSSQGVPHCHWQWIPRNRVFYINLFIQQLWCSGHRDSEAPSTYIYCSWRPRIQSPRVGFAHICCNCKIQKQNWSKFLDFFKVSWFFDHTLSMCISRSLWTTVEWDYGPQMDAKPILPTLVHAPTCLSEILSGPLFELFFLFRVQLIYFWFKSGRRPKTSPGHVHSCQGIIDGMQLFEF